MGAHTSAGACMVQHGMSSQVQGKSARALACAGAGTCEGPIAHEGSIPYGGSINYAGSVTYGAIADAGTHAASRGHSSASTLVLEHPVGRRRRLPPCAAMPRDEPVRKKWGRAACAAVRAASPSEPRKTHQHLSRPAGYPSTSTPSERELLLKRVQRSM